MSVYVGLDFGEVRVGVAVSDNYKKLALPLAVIEREGGSFGFNKLAKLLADRDVEAFVLGNPLDSSGAPGSQSGKVHKYAEGLEKFFNKKVIIWDERFSTAHADRLLSNTRSKSRRKIIDKVAAQLILQSYLDSIQKQ